MKAQSNNNEGCWWDIWDTSRAAQCLLELRVEKEMVDRAIAGLLSKKYPQPENNWLNVHTTAAVLEVVAETAAECDNRAIAARTWLEKTVEARLDSLDIWSLALATRALNRFAGESGSALCERAVARRLVQAVRDPELDTLDLCEVSLTLLECAPRLIGPSYITRLIDEVEREPKAVSEFLCQLVCSLNISGVVRSKEEREASPYVVQIGLTRRQVLIIGVVGSIASIAGLILFFFLS